MANIACEAAVATGSMIAKAKVQQVNTKEDHRSGESLASQVVTEIDLKSEALIKEALANTLIEFDLALLTEETEDDGLRFEKDYFWCVDPLDGTLFFIEGEPGYSVSIALVDRAGRPKIGVVYDIANEILYHGLNGAFFRNRKPWPINSGKKDTLHFIFDKSFQEFKLFGQIVSELEVIAKNLGYSGLETSNRGGAVLNACWVLDHGSATYFKLAKNTPGGGSLWDFAATACLFEQAGVHVSDINLQRLDLNRADSTFMNHRGMLYASEKRIADEVASLVARL